MREEHFFCESRVSREPNKRRALESPLCGGIFTRQGTLLFDGYTDIRVNMRLSLGLFLFFLKTQAQEQRWHVSIRRYANAKNGREEESEWDEWKKMNKKKARGQWDAREWESERRAHRVERFDRCVHVQPTRTNKNVMYANESRRAGRTRNISLVCYVHIVHSAARPPLLCLPPSFPRSASSHAVLPPLSPLSPLELRATFFARAHRT